MYLAHGKGDVNVQIELATWLGYVVMISFGIIFFGTSSFIAKRFPIEGVDDFVVAGRQIPFAIIAASVMVSWVWTTTIMGAAEAGMWFGVSGGINYAWGCAVPFFIFIPLVIYLRKLMPKCTTFTEFIEQRFGKKTRSVFFAFGVGLIMYVFVQQGVGVGIAFSSIFGIPYKIAAFVPVMIVTLYIAKAGLRGSLFNDLLQFFIIAGTFLIVIPYVLNHFGTDFVYNGLIDVATNPDNPNYNPDVLNLLSGAGFRYGIAVVVIAMGQVLLEQGYYSKAMAAVNTKSLLYAYLVGTLFAWAPIPILSANVFGNVGLALGIDPVLTTDVSPMVLSAVFGTGIGTIAFVLMVFMAALTTGGNCLAGAQALFTVDFYKRYVNQKATELEQLSFGRKITIAVGLIVGIVAMMLEGVSLLMIDIFSGIIFAAPCSALFAGMFWRKPTALIALISIVAGLAAGAIAWFGIPDPNLNWFVANVLALTVPAIVVIVFSPFSKEDFDFKKLQGYDPGHTVHVKGEA